MGRRTNGSFINTAPAANVLDLDYDATGNRLSSSGQSQSAAGSHNRLSTDGTYNYLYDNEGNTIRRTRISDGSVHEMAWDHRNRLASVTDFAIGAASELGRRLTDSVFISVNK